jgi:hypothetical protein
MTGLGFASVPLYRMFCQATGLNGTTQRGIRAPGAWAEDHDRVRQPMSPRAFPGNSSPSGART